MSGVTPAILSVDIALGMQREIEKLYQGQDGASFLYISLNSILTLLCTMTLTQDIFGGEFKDSAGNPAKWDEIVFHLLTKKGRS